jgi:crotonobetainyl-CoA:carnitine CoA-transferase CaiB-like acyl-CoA transferase
MPFPPPLAGVRVLTLAINLPGPVAAARMRDLGAQVVKIEPTTGDPMAFAHPGAYAELHQGVDVRQADLKSSAGREMLHDLLGETDLLLTSSRLAALERLGLDWPALGDRCPRLCWAAIVGYPPPDEHHPGHDLTYQARNGLVAPPAMPLSALADLGGATEAVLAGVALLYVRATRPDAPSDARRALVPLSDAASHFAMTWRWGLTAPGGVLGGALPQYNIYECRVGWIALAALEPHFWARLQQLLEIDNPTQDQLAQVFRNKSADEWQIWAETNDLPLVAVLSKSSIE